MNKKIVWKKWENPIKYLNTQGEESDSNIMLKHTPFGIMPIKLSSEMYNQKNVFVGHTNFDIDQNILEIIDNTPGVESLQLISPYRFQIIVGMAFNSKSVRQNISNRLCKKDDNFSFSVEDDNKIYNETLSLRKAGKPWLLYVLPNGKFESKQYENDDNLEKDISLYNSFVNRIGGVVISDNSV